MPALVAGTHSFLAALSAGRTWMAGSSQDQPGHERREGFDMTGINSKEHDPLGGAL